MHLPVSAGGRTVDNIENKSPCYSRNERRECLSPRRHPHCGALGPSQKYRWQAFRHRYKEVFSKQSRGHLRILVRMPRGHIGGMPIPRIKLAITVTCAKVGPESKPSGGQCWESECYDGYQFV